MQATHAAAKAELFWSRVDKTAGCWNWTAATSRSGRGVMRWRGEPTLAYRISWELTHGAPPGEFFVCHRCDNTRCVNPEHLFLGTSLDNVRDMWSKGRASAPPRHRGETHPQVFDSDEFVQRCRDEHAAGSNAKQIALKYDIPHTTVWGWVTGRSRTKDSA